MGVYTVLIKDNVFTTSGFKRRVVSPRLIDTARVSTCILPVLVASRPHRPFFLKDY